MIVIGSHGRTGLQAAADGKRGGESDRLCNLPRAGGETIDLMQIAMISAGCFLLPSAPWL